VFCAFVVVVVLSVTEIAYQLIPQQVNKSIKFDLYTSIKL